MDAVFDHDDGGIDDQPEVNGPKAHQTRRNTEHLHHAGGEKH